MTLPDIRTEPELVALRRIAETLASTRRERVTSAHLLAAIASEASVASELLLERRLTAEQLLRAARSSTDDERDPLTGAEQRARELASRMRGPEPGALHLLVALLSVKGSAAYRVLDQFGVDVVRLRLLAMNIGLGHLQRRTTARTLSTRRAVTVPLTPRPQSIRPTLAGRAATAAPTPRPLELVAPANDPAVEVTPKTKSLAPSEPASTDKSGLADKDVKPKPKRNKKKDATTRFALDPKRFKVLCELGYNWCERVARGELPEVVERPREVERILDVLAKKDANNPCLVGPSGVGKTSLIQALAERIVDERSLTPLDDRILVEIRVSDLLAGTGVRGALAERIEGLRRELAAASGRIVLVFEDVHQLFAPDSTEECGGILRRALAEGALPCIGISNADAYARFIESEPSLARCFSRLDVDEPDADLCETILLRAAERLASHHQVTFQADVLQKAVTWSSRYVTERALPDKAIALLDLAGAKARRRGGTVVDALQVATVVSERASVPVERLLETDGQRLLNLEQTLAQRVVGHEEALSKICRIVRRNAAGLGGNRPIGTFLLLGPTGVGKTESAKALAFALFGSESAMTRLDLSEYSEAHAVARLIGAPPGYIGHEAGGQLTEAVKRRPYQVLLFDEVEKAHPEVLETFLPLLDEGRLTDGRGRTVDFTNTVILLTSNLGAREAANTGTRRLGFGNDGASHNQEETVIEAAKRALAPEFYNRMDEVLVYKPLDRALVTEIARRLLQKLVDTVMQARNIELRIDPAVIDLLLSNGGFDSQMGARPMKRAIARLVEAPLAECLLSGDAPPVMEVTVESGSIVLGASSNAAE